MKKSVKCLITLVSTISVLSSFNPMISSATTKEDVIAVAREVGMPENLVQSYISLGANIQVTSEQCDKAIAKLYEIYGTTNDKINQDFDVDIPNEPVVTTQTQVPIEEPNNSVNQDVETSNIDNNNNNNVVTTTQSQQSNTVNQTTTSNASNLNAQQSTVTTQNTQQSIDTTQNGINSNIDIDYQSPIEESEFISMSYDEKIEFVNSLSQEEKTMFMSNLTTAERNSIIKQMDMDSKAEIVNSIVEAGKSLGYNFSVDELSADNISLSLRDSEGTLVGVTNFGTSVDDTGKNYTGLILSMIAIMGVCGYSLFKISKKIR